LVHNLAVYFLKIFYLFYVRAVILKYDLKIRGSLDTPLVTLLHGRAHSMEVMSIFVRALPDHWNILYVQAPIPDAQGGWCWWDISQDKTGELIESQKKVLPLLAGTIEFVLKKYSLSPLLSVLLGFSQGAATSMLLLQMFMNRWDGVASMGGFVPKLAEGLLEVGLEKNVRKTSILFLHGTEDLVIPVQKAEEGVEFLKSRGFTDISLFTEPVGHKVGARSMRVLKEWLVNLSGKHVTNPS
jgi:predicted esterase